MTNVLHTARTETCFSWLPEVETVGKEGGVQVTLRERKVEERE